MLEQKFIVGSLECSNALSNKIKICFSAINYDHDDIGNLTASRLQRDLSKIPSPPEECLGMYRFWPILKYVLWLTKIAC